MKFRCRMIDSAAMRDFTNVANTVSRLAKACVIRLTKDEVCFHVGDDYSPIAWAVLYQNKFFSEYTMIGVCEEQNEIYLEFSPAMLAKSLSSLKMTAKSVKIKLTNREQPCLTIDIELPSISNELRQCVHDVPVKVIPRKEWGEYQAPIIPSFDVSIEMPDMKHLRNVVDQMGKMSPQLVVTAKKTGKLILKVETSFATVATHFQDLKVGGDDRDSGVSDEEEEEVSATIDIRKFGMFLTWDIIKAESVICNVVADRMINMHMNIDGHLEIHYFIPAISIL
ncbi:checkpoint protein HUS1 [Neodiprion virginianus]|uniref:checkpoint protein HUS1 n=1 Tax=Neodiprion virginianus TaxID=2961670 RepID=UPI001EE6DEC6|nr:checkpoint protein HUS1 [Neodiprion virginianus]